MIFLILALIWAAVLLPPLVRSRLEGNPVDSVGRFRRHLRVLESTAPLANDLAHSAADSRFGTTASSMPAAWEYEARRLSRLRRRQQVAVVLLGVMATTLVLGLIPSLRFLLAFHVVADVAFVGYIAMLVQLRTQRVGVRRDVDVASEDVATEATGPLASQAL